MVSTPPDGRAGIDAALVTRLIAAQFPQWADLPVVPVKVDGWDNRTYRLGDDMSVRLPTAAGYVPAVAKENEWLPRLAPSLPLPVPSVLGKGVPVKEAPNEDLPGLRMMTVVDPDGNQLRIATRLQKT